MNYVHQLLCIFKFEINRTIPMDYFYDIFMNFEASKFWWSALLMDEHKYLRFNKKK